MARPVILATDGTVQKILNNDYSSTIDLQPYIDSASLVMQRLDTCATTRKNITLTDDEYAYIWRWLSAHFYMVMAGQNDWRKGEGVSSSFKGKSDMYFESTTYGQQAMAIDPSGCLYEIGTSSRRVAVMNWLGKNPSNQIDYEDRR